MAERFSPTPEDMVERADDFLDVAELPANAGIFNLDNTALAAWRAQTDAMQTLLDQRHTLETQLDGVSAQIKSSAPALEAATRAGLRTAAASSAPDGLKSEAGVTIPKPRVNSAPISPTELLATPNVNGTVLLKCNRAGNIRGAKFVFEKKTVGDWVLLDIVTATELTAPAKVGERAAFRVSARNGQGTSLPSNEAIIYDS